MLEFDPLPNVKKTLRVTRSDGSVIDTAEYGRCDAFRQPTWPQNVSGVCLSENSAPLANAVEYVEFCQARAMDRPRQPFTVVLVGGGSNEIDVGFRADAVVRFGADGADAAAGTVDVATTSRKFFVKLNDAASWSELNEYVATHGKFDFSICSNVLQHTNDPETFCHQLSLISKAGHVAVPSKYHELAFTEEAHRHRWIFTLRNNRLMAYPKLPFLRHDDRWCEVRSKIKAQLSFCFFWDTYLQAHAVDTRRQSACQIFALYGDLTNDDIDATLW